MNAKIGEFYYGKIPMSYNNHLDGRYKIRPLLIIGVQNKYYKCLTITSKIRSYGMCRIDIPPKYGLPKHSQLICDEVSIVSDKNLREFISKCDWEDFDYILNRYNEIKENK